MDLIALTVHHWVPYGTGKKIGTPQFMRTLARTFSSYSMQQNPLNRGVTCGKIADMEADIRDSRILNVNFYRVFVDDNLRIEHHISRSHFLFFAIYRASSAI